MSTPILDALGRALDPTIPRARVVSLVPSETESVVAMVGVARLVGRTDFCEEPAAELERVPSVGGTKRFDPAAVIALAPDLVLANKEENGRSDVEALLAAGLDVHVSFPRTLADNVAYLDALAALLGAPDAARRERDLLRSHASATPDVRASVAAPIWREPWMTFDERTYASDVLRAIGAHNVFSGRPRAYPLAADLRQAAPLPPERTAGRDTRYPRFEWSELVERAPQLLLLPDEPYRFGEAERSELSAALPQAQVALVSGKDLFWYGVRSADAIARLGAQLDQLLSSGR